MHRWILAVVLLSAFASSASATLLTNGGFELPQLPDAGNNNIDDNDGDFSLHNHTGWIRIGTGGSGVYDPGSGTITPNQTEGKQVVFLNQIGSPYLYQTTTTALAPLTTYTFSIDVGRGLGNPVYPWEAGIYAGANPTVGTVLTSSTTVSGTPVLPVPTAGSWASVTLTYTTGASIPSGNVGVYVRNTSASAQILFDNAVLTAVSVPEPTGLFLLSGGAIGLVGTYRRRTVRN
jgi:hypothetical protein